jgi:hypothetical protein
MFDKVGAIGYISRLFPIIPIRVIRVDENGLNVFKDFSYEVGSWSYGSLNLLLRLNHMSLKKY